MTDYANTTYAAQNRLAKAKTIAVWCWANGVTAEHLTYATDTEWAKVARHATGRPASDQTRELVHALVLLKEAWAAAHPTHPDARRTTRPSADVAALTPGAPRS